MPDTVISRVKTIGRYEPKLLTFTDRHGCLIRNVETPGVGADSDEGEVEFLEVDAKQEEEETEMLDIDTEVNEKLPGVDMEGQETPPQVVDIYDPDIPQYPSLMAPEVPADPDGPTQVLTPYI